ncbi:MAG: DUF6471 domain-containing protein [Alteromonadaceae bacterium]|nr:DUF6471 domain-containing protein [Alteromonadaceae bacterium]
MEGAKANGLEYEEVSRRLLKAEMAKRSLHWDDLSRDLASVGIDLSSANLRRMVSMGTLRASVFLALIELYEIDTANSEEIRHYIKTIRRYPVGPASAQFGKEGLTVLAEGNKHERKGTKSRSCPG